MPWTRKPIGHVFTLSQDSKLLKHFKHTNCAPLTTTRQVAFTNQHYFDICSSKIMFLSFPGYHCSSTLTRKPSLPYLLSFRNFSHRHSKFDSAPYASLCITLPPSNNRKRNSHSILTDVKTQLLRKV